MHVEIALQGMTGLVMHNERLADPQDPYTKGIAEINKKRTNKTEADAAEIERLEWFGGLYHDPDIGVYIPTWSLVRCFERAATNTRQGTKLIAALAVLSDKAALTYEGSRDLEKLYAQPEFRLRKMVGVQRSRVPRMRPIFRKWSLTLEAELLEDVMNPRDFVGICELAGRANGLGDARKLGYGRFVADVRFPSGVELAA